jgi:phospholipase D1/2
MGRPYRPFHDVQMMVDGAAARALAELARQRWCRAYGGEPALEDGADAWPDDVTPDFKEVDVAIARTQPHYDGLEGAREVEGLFIDSIGAARRSIYIENQFLSSSVIAQRLVRQLRRHPELEVVIVAPRTHDSWVERRTMRNGRIRFWHKVCTAGGDRVRLVYPAVEHAGKATDTMIHSKVMVIDDRLLRVGSANLNNRSMGADTECDLAIEARTGRERAAILEIRNRLLGEHCGASAADVAQALERHGSLVRVADTLGANGHSLRPIEDGKLDVSRLSRLVEQLADPIRPVPLRRLARRMVRPGRTALIVAGLALAVLGITLAWRFTGLADIATPAFLVAGAIAFPINILVLATAAAFGPWLGALYSAIGSLASALIMYFVGAHFGQARLMRLLGHRARRALEAVRRRGVLAVVTFRIVPVAPFTIVNLAAGASAIAFGDFVVGSLIGMAPGLALVSFMGDRIVAIVSDPTAEEIAILALAIVGYIGLALGAQALLSRRGGHRR